MRFNRTTIALLATCLALNAGLVLQVASGEGQLLALTVYLLALGMAVAAIWNSTRPGADRRFIERADTPLIGAVIGIQLLGLIYMSTFPFHYVQDEFITGYTSYTLPAFSEIEWFAGYPRPGEWIAGFSIVYFALQKPFIAVFGLSLETIRVSTWPYHLLTAALVYLVGKELFRCRIWSFAAAIGFIVLAPNLYMAGYGMHNISSAFAFLAAFYAAIRMVRDDSRFWAIACGLFTALAYLTYTSSYLAIPMIALFIALSAAFDRSWRPVVRFGQALIITAISLVPFLTYAATEQNYVSQRGDQVNAISRFAGDEAIDSPARAIIDHVATNIRALYTPDIGGVTDYWFGRQALFDWLTLSLLLAGMGIAIFQGVRRRQALELTIPAIVLATFIAGMFLTLPAGGFHRTTLAFPFIGLLIALTLRTVIDGVLDMELRPRLHAASTAILLSLFILINLTRVQTMTTEDEQISSLTDSVPITAFIEDHVPDGSAVIVSSFPGYHLEREIIVRTGHRYDVRIEPFNEAVEHGGDTVIILFQPSSDQIHRLEARYGGGSFIDVYDGRDLRRHLIWMPSRDSTYSGGPPHRFSESVTPVAGDISASEGSPCRPGCDGAMAQKELRGYHRVNQFGKWYNQRVC